MNVNNLANTYLAIGIELARTYSRVAAFQNHAFQIVINEQGQSKIPSLVSFLELGVSLVGFEAEDRSHDVQRDTVLDFE